MYFIVPESPDFLYAKGRFEEAEKVALQIAEFNGKPLRADEVDLKP